MNWFIDVFAEDYNDSNVSALASIRRLQESDRSGPCEDDATEVAPYIGVCPDETDHEDASPLDFGPMVGPNIGMRFVRRSKR
jgi:hypothetical protein